MSGIPLEFESLSGEDSRVESTGEPVRLSLVFEIDMSISFCGGCISGCGDVRADKRGGLQGGVTSVVSSARCGLRT